MLSHTFDCFNTTNTLSVHGADANLLLQAEKMCLDYEHAFSRFNAEGELFLLNNAKGVPTPVSTNLAQLLQACCHFAAETEGIFDPTIGPASQLWNFQRGQLADDSDLQDALEHVNYLNLIVRGNTAQLLDPHAVVDVGGIAKGFVADKLIAFFQENKVDHAMVNLGGNVAVQGGKPDGSPWNIGVRNPVSSFEKGGLDAFVVVKLINGSVVTSGIYERAFFHRNKLYHHILDSSTGLPAQTDLLSATVVSRTSLEGDGLSTALIIMGSEKALNFVEKRPNLEAVFVTADNKVLTTSGMGTSIPYEVL